ncbi:MAG: hypothetical protein RIM84_25160 [Alphaproteobacteria bacterium]
MSRPRRQTEELPAHEELLLDYAQRLRRHVAGRRAIHLHLSKLARENRRPQHLRAAASTFERLVADHEGQCYQLSNADLVVVAKNAKVSAIDELVLRLRFLFKDDPLAEDADAEGNQDAAEFCTWYDLEEDYEDFLRLAIAAEQALHAHQHRLDTTTRPAEPKPDAPRLPLDPAGLGRLEELVETTDLSVMLKRQTVAAVNGNALPTPVFSELYVSIDELRRRVMPNVDIAGTPWLFQHLTPHLDRRVLRLVPEREAGHDGVTSININVSTVLAEDFLAFERRLRAVTTKSMMLEFQAVDILADVGAFRFARDLARDRNFKVCLDGLSHLAFPLLRRDELDVDFMKIIWRPRAAAEMSLERMRELRRAVLNAGPERVVLAHCDDEAAVNFGESIGVNLFQGRHVDVLVGDIVGGR